MNTKYNISIFIYFKIERRINTFWISTGLFPQEIVIALSSSVLLKTVTLTTMKGIYNTFKKKKNNNNNNKKVNKLTECFQKYIILKIFHIIYIILFIFLEYIYIHLYILVSHVILESSNTNIKEFHTLNSQGIL